MTIINLISKVEYHFLLDTYREYPNLTLQNKGYEYINPNELTGDDKLKIKEVSTLLRKAILGFRKFFNFRLNKAGDLEIRFDYLWDADKEGDGQKSGFVGVGYILLDTLLNGFKH